jgi:hypothetical protein
MLKALNLSTFMYQTGTVESLLNLKYWSISLVVVPLVLLALVVVILVRPTVRYVSFLFHAHASIVSASIERRNCMSICFISVPGDTALSTQIV